MGTWMESEVSIMILNLPLSFLSLFVSMRLATGFRKLPEALYKAMMSDSKTVLDCILVPFSSGATV